MSAPAYNWREENGVMTVLDVEVMSRLSSKTRDDLDEGDVVDDAYLQDVVEKTKRRIQNGKPPQLLLRHNPDPVVDSSGQLRKNAPPATVIGRLSRPVFRDGWIHADLIVTDPETKERLKLGNLPNKSAEFYMKERKLWGLSLIEGEEGHFGDLCPDLVLKDTIGEIITAPESFALDNAGKGDTLLLQIHNRPIKLAKRQTMADDKTKLEIKGLHSAVKLAGGSVEVQATPESEVVTVSEQPTAEETAAIAAAAAEPAMTEIESLKATIAQLQEALAAKESGDVALETEEETTDEEETENLAAEDEDEEKKDMKLSHIRSEAAYILKEAGRVRLSKLVDTVIESGSVLTRNQITTKLAAFKTKEGREQHAELLKLQTQKAGETPEDESGKPEQKETYATKLAAAHQKSAAWKDRPEKEFEAWLIKRGHDHSLRA